MDTFAFFLVKILQHSSSYFKNDAKIRVECFQCHVFLLKCLGSHKPHSIHHAVEEACRFGSVFYRNHAQPGTNVTYIFQ